MARFFFDVEAVRTDLTEMLRAGSSGAATRSNTCDDEPEPGLNVPRRRRPPGGGVYADEMSPEDIFNMCDLGVPSCRGAFTPSS